MCLVCCFFFLMIRRPPRSTQSRSSAASDVYKRQALSRRVFYRPSLPKEPPLPPPLYAVSDFKRQTLCRGVDRPAEDRLRVLDLSLIHISEPTRLGMISYAVF